MNHARENRQACQTKPWEWKEISNQVQANWSKEQESALFKATREERWVKRKFDPFQRPQTGRSYKMKVRFLYLETTVFHSFRV